MLAHLHVKNLALIEEIEVEFGPGLNILTGETLSLIHIYQKYVYPGLLTAEDLCKRRGVQL